MNIPSRNSFTKCALEMTFETALIHTLEFDEALGPLAKTTQVLCNS